MDERLTTLIETLLDPERAGDELAALSDDQIASLDAELVEAFRSARAGETEGVEPDDLAHLSRLRDARFAVIGETQARFDAAEVANTEAAQRAEDAAALDAEMGLAAAEADEDEDAEASAEGETDDDSEEEDAAAGEAAVETPDEPESTETEEAVTASRPSLAQLATARRPAEARPAPRSAARATPRFQLNDGSMSTSMEDVAERMSEAINQFVSAPKGVKDRIPVARLQVEYPEEQRIVSHDPTEVARKMAALTAGADDPNTWERARQDADLGPIVASGGFCAPSEPRYDVYSIVSADRPVRGGLPRIGVDRGAITYVQARRLSTVLADQAGAAITTWPESTDITPGESTKTTQAFACRTPIDRPLQAIVASERFGNFQARAFPELVADDIKTTMGQHARVAERALLDQIITDIATNVTETGVLGTARDLQQVLLQAKAQIQSVERSTNMMRAILPREAIGMILQDVAFQQASGELDALFLTEDQARAMLARIVNLSLAMDTPTGADAFVTNSTGENLADWPDNFEVPFFPEGSVAFLDGGTLDLGLVRDSTLNNTNDYELFMETLESTAYFGPHALTLTLTTCPNGESQVATDETGSLCSGS